MFGRVSQIILHPGFLQSTLVNDAALLRLSTPIPAGVLSPVALNTDPSRELRDVPLVVAGWGVTSENSQTSSPVLRDVTVAGVRMCLDTLSLVDVRFVAYNKNPNNNPLQSLQACPALTVAVPLPFLNLVLGS